MFESIIQLQQGNRALYNENPLVRWRDIVLLAILYFVTARIGQLFAIPPGNVTPVWIPSGIIVAAILYRGYEIWPGIFIGAFTGNIWAYFISDNTLALVHSVIAGFFNGVGDTLGAVIGVYFILLKCKTPYPFNRTIHLLYFVLFGALLSSSISAGFGVSALWANGFISDMQFNNVLATWFTGDAVGTVILAPFILSLVNSPNKMGSSREKFVYFLLLVLISIFALGVLADTPKSTFLFLLLPFTLWAILRFDQHTVFGSILLISVLSISTLLLNVGWFSTLDENRQLTELQQFVFIFAISVMLLSTLQKERSNAENNLLTLNEELVQIVTDRTKDIHEKNRQLLLDQEVLKESEQRFRDVASISADWIWEFDENAHFTYASEGIRGILGYAPEELLGKSAFDLMHKDEAQKVKQEFDEFAKQGKPFRQLENIKVDNYGKEHVMMSSGVPVYDNKGNFKGYRGVDRDITEQKSMERNLLQQAHYDYLTGVYNRGYFMLVADKELRRSIRYNNELSLLMIDVDFFKAVNDRYGHSAGDLVLIELTQICKNTLRHHDILGRIGGEEFAVLLPETDKDKAIEVADRLRENISNAVINFADGIDIQLSVSIGVTHLCEKETSLDKLLILADKALYEAKETGRNKVCFDWT